MFLAQAANLVRFDIPGWHWVVLLGWFAGLLLIDLLVLHRKDHEPTLKRAASESAVWVGLGLGLGVVIWLLYGSLAGQQYFSGYLIEKSLSVDNVFAWSVILSYFAIPMRYQYRVLFWGIFGALVMRAIFIFAGIAAIERFEPIVIVFGAILFFTGLRLLRARGGEHFDPGSSKLYARIRGRIHVSRELDGHKFITRENGKRVFTMLFIALLVVEFTDVIFAVDSVPAILAISRDPFIVFSSNAAAIIGLRSLYFVFAKIKDTFFMLNKALGVLMLLIGLKMAASPEEIFGLQWFGFHMPTTLSLILIAGIIGSGIILSLLTNHGKSKSLDY